MQRPRITVAAVLLSALVLLAACLPGLRAPDVPATRTLELGGTPAAAPPAGAFAVVFSAPQGETRGASEVTVVFNRPMHALELAGDEAQPPVRIAVRGTGAAPKGSWRWMGTSALVFSPPPETRLPNATEYVVTVPAGTKALTGETLAAAFESTFSTPRPQVVRLEPDGGDQLVPGQTFEARFDQAVDPREVERATRLTVGEGKAAQRIALRASRPDPGNAKLLKLVPVSPLPLASKVDVTFDESLRGVDGPLPMEKPRSFSMATYGPLVVREVHCWKVHAKKCRPGASFQLELSNAVSLADLRAHLRIVPAAPIAWPTAGDGGAKVRDVSVPATLRAGLTYRVTVTAGLRDERGQALARDFDKALSMDDLAPAVVVGLNGTVIEAASVKGRAVPVTAVNTPSYALLSGPLDERALAELVAPRTGDDQRADRVFARLEKLPAMRVEQVAAGAARNTSVARRVPIEPLLADRGGRGAFVIATRETYRVANVTDLAVTAKMSRFGSVVWVTRLSDGKAVPGASVAIADRGGNVFETRTDADGLAAIPADRYQAADGDGSVDRDRLVVARLGDDWTWRRVGDVFRWGDDGVWVDASGGLKPLGMLFTDRGVYRPGETIELAAIFRLPRPRGTETPSGREVELTATDPGGESIFTSTVKLDDFGAASVHVPVPATARLGTAQILAKMPGEPGEGTATTVQLAAYKAAEFKVAADAAAPAFMRGEEGRFDVHGDYLFGAPMAGAKVHWTLTRARGSFAPPGAEGFVVDDDSYESELPSRAPRAGKVQSGDGALDAHGVMTARAALALEGQHGAEVVSFEAEVEDVSRQTVAARASAVVHPAAFYVGLRRPKDWFIASGEAARAEVAAIEPGGKRRAGIAVHVDLLRRTWSNVLESTGESSGHWESRVVDTPAGACDVATGAAGTAPCALPVREAGYYLVHARARDEKGREVQASYGVYVIGEGGDAGWAATDATTVALVPDKKAYQVGDVARILVKSPFREADALVTVERSGVYTQQRVHLVGATPTVTVPVTEDLRPNAFVSVHLVRGRTKAAPARGADVGAPAFKSGTARLVVDPESRRLKVALTTARKELRPGETVEADVAVTDATGKPVQGELTMWAVDEGVLMLTGYATPDPIPTFTAPRPLAVFGLESRADLARIFRASFGELGADKGDEGGGGGEAMRADFRATAWFQGGIVTGPDGLAHARFKLPDNLTTFRVMAVAAARDDRFGDGEAQVTTSRPLMLRPALPRFLRAGDAIDAGVVVSTKGLPDARVEVAIAADGAIVSGETKRVVPVKNGESVEVRWAIAAPRTGQAKLSFRARAGGESDAVQVTKRVDAPATLETVALEGETRDASAEKLGELGAIRDDVGGLDLRLASTALVGVGDGMEQLLEYPYGCTEQLTSRLVPLVAARDLATAYGVPLPKDPDHLADVAIAKILDNQRGDGGFGWWPDSRESDPWVTAYALWGLDVARKAGRPVPDAAVDSAVRWLRGRLGRLEGSRTLDRERTPSPTSTRAVDLAGRAMVVDVLATIGKADPGFTNRLYDVRADMPLFARALLAHAIVQAKMDRGQAEELLRDLEQHLRITPESATVVDQLGDSYAAVLDSQPRTTAIVLRALVALDPKHALAPRLARGLLGERRNGQWASTHEAAWSLLALDDYRRLFEREAPDFDARVWAGGELALDAPFRGRGVRQQEATVPAARLLAHGEPTVAFQVEGAGTLFYEARLRYARKELPRDTIDRGFFVRKLVRSVTPDGLRDALATIPAQTQARVRAGDLVLVDLVLVTPNPREQVVLDDPLPAGLEAVDTTMATTAASLDVADPGGEGDEEDAQGRDDDAVAAGRAWGQAWYHREIRDDRVLTFVEHMPAGIYHYRYLARATTAGRFLVPPTKAECMYDPGVFGRTPGAALEVAAP